MQCSFTINNNTNAMARNIALPFPKGERDMDIITATT